MFFIREITFLISSLCFENAVSEEVEFTRNITVPTREVCEELIPPEPRGNAEVNNKVFAISARWTTHNDVLVHALNLRPRDTAIRGVIIQAKLNGTPIGTFLPAPEYFALDCPPGTQNTLTGIIPQGESAVMEFWTCPPDLEPGKSITMHVTILAPKGTYYLNTLTVSSGGRSEVANVVKEWGKGNNLPLPL